MKKKYFQFLVLACVYFCVVQLVDAQCSDFEFTDSDKFIYETFNYFDGSGVSSTPAAHQICKVY